MDPQTSRPTRRVVLAGAGVALGTAGLLAAVAAPAGASTGGHAAEVRQLVAEAKKAILSHSAVRVTSTGRNTSTHKVTGHTVSDAGRHWGRQTLVAGSMEAKVLFTPTYAYFSGNKDGLTSIFGMPADDQGRVGTKWVSVEKSEPQYQGFASTVLGALPGEILPKTSSAGSVQLSIAHRKGHKVHLLEWTSTVNGTKVQVALELAASGQPLPLVERESAGSNEQDSVFGHWDEHVKLATPKHAVPYKSLSAT